MTCVAATGQRGNRCWWSALSSCGLPLGVVLVFEPVWPIADQRRGRHADLLRWGHAGSATHRGTGRRRLEAGTDWLLRVSLPLPLKDREVVYEVLHPGGGLSGQLLGREVSHRCGGGAQLVGAPGQRSSLAQERGDRSCRSRNGAAHMLVGHVADCPLIGLELARPLGGAGAQRRTMGDETCAGRPRGAVDNART